MMLPEPCDADADVDHLSDELKDLGGTSKYLRLVIGKYSNGL
jgi:hypothetical protein